MKFDEYRKVLWDIDEKGIGNLPDAFVVRRVLAYGSIFLIFKAIHTFGKSFVAHEFSLMKRESMNSRRYSYLLEFVLT